jgi:hypothetical protein
MTEQEKCCGTCAMVNGDEECRNRKPTFYCTAWTPKAAPQPAKALPTLAEVNALLPRGCGHVPNAFERIVRAIRPLVEAEECRVAITAAGCATWTQPDGTVDVWTNESDGLVRKNGCTWPEARAWAEEQKAKREEETAKQAARERIAKAGATLVETEYNGVHVWRIPMSFGAVEVSSVDDVKGDGAYYLRAAAFAEEQAAKREEAQWSPEVTAAWSEAMCERVCEVLGYTEKRGCRDRAWLCGRATALGRYSEARLSVWLGDGPMPEGDR